jgi:DNA (cytosine-5)-methyltransferase 1
MSKAMRELSLFSGAGGGLLASKHLLGWSTIGYVEYNDYCQRVIAQRIRDGLLDDAPIFGDIRAFLSEGFAASYTGMVDVVSGGFPCQPFSQAGKQLGVDDPRNMWPATLQVLRITRPEFAFLENVPGLLGSGYFGTILGDLADMGMDAQWGVLGGACADSCCESERLWIVASSSDCPMLEGVDFSKYLFSCQEEPCRRQYSRAIGAMLSQDDYTSVKRNPDVVARNMDRLKAIGNGQVPAVAATAWRILSGEQ